jgi:hypothetical protein
MSFYAAPSDNNAVRASARLRRAPGYTAPKARGYVNDLEEMWRDMVGGRSCHISSKKFT